MSWQVLLPIADKLLDAAIDYYKSSYSEQGAAVAQLAAPEEAQVKPAATVLLIVEYEGEDLPERIKEALELIDGLEVKALEVKKDGA